MAHKKTDLVPTLIINKNGVRTTVHRKPVAGASSSNKLPAPPVITEPSPMPAISFDMLAKPEGVSDQNMEDAFQVFFNSNTDLVELSTRLLTTGTSTGQRLVRDVLSESVGNIATHFHRSGERELRYAPHGGMTTSYMIRGWSYGNIREEAGLSPDTINEADLHQYGWAKSCVTMGDSYYNEIPEEEYRTMSPAVEKFARGCAVLSICFDFDDNGDDADDMWQHFDTFIPWAAEHEDIGKVIWAAKTAGTIKVEDVDRFIKASDDGVPTSLMSGWV
jgi:hypothetical protein